MQAQPDWGEELRDGQSITDLQQTWTNAWQDCVVHALTDNRGLFLHYRDQELQSVLLSASCNNLLHRSGEYINESGLNAYASSAVVNTVIWGHNATFGGAYYESADNGGYSETGRSHGAAIGTITFEFKARGDITFLEEKKRWALGLNDWRYEYPSKSEQLRDVSLVVSITPPARSFEDAVRQGVADAFRNAHDMTQIPSHTGLVNRATSRLMALQSELNSTWELVGRNRRNSVIWYTASCTLALNESGKPILNADLGGWRWQGAEEQELERQSVTRVLPTR